PDAADVIPQDRQAAAISFLASSLLSDETLALAVGPLGIFFLDCGDRDHLAVVTLAAQPSKKDAFEQLGVETVGLGTPMLARYGYARCMNNVRLDVACPEPARQPKTVPTSLEGNCNAFDPLSFFLCFLSPAMQ